MQALTNFRRNVNFYYVSNGNHIVGLTEPQLWSRTPKGLAGLLPKTFLNLNSETPHGEDYFPRIRPYFDDLGRRITNLAPELVEDLHGSKLQQNKASGALHRELKTLDEPTYNPSDFRLFMAYYVGDYVEIGKMKVHEIPFAILSVRDLGHYQDLLTPEPSKDQRYTPNITLVYVSGKPVAAVVEQDATTPQDDKKTTGEAKIFSGEILIDLAVRVRTLFDEHLSSVEIPIPMPSKRNAEEFNTEIRLVVPAHSFGNSNPETVMPQFV